MFHKQSITFNYLSFSKSGIILKISVTLNWKVDHIENSFFIIRMLDCLFSLVFMRVFPPSKCVAIESCLPKYMCSQKVFWLNSCVMEEVVCLWHFANIKFKIIIFSFFHRLRVVLNYRERWTGWHQIRARMMISSQFPYPTVTRMETSMLNRSVNVCMHFSWSLI